MRLFYALWPDDATRAALSGLLQHVKGRKIRPANLHITLAFLGEQDESALPALQSLLNNLPASDLKLAIDRLGYFSRQRIAWAGLKDVPDELIVLHKALHERLDKLGIAYDRRSAFKPHITLARDAAPPGDASIATITWHANHISLVQSTTQPEGVRYQLIASRFSDQDSANIGIKDPGIKSDIVSGHNNRPDT